MSTYLKEFIKYIASIHRYFKRLIVIIIDLNLCLFSTWCAYSLRFDTIISLKNLNFFPAILSMGILILVFWFSGIYRSILRYTNSSIYKLILKSILIYSSIYCFIIIFLKFENVPRSIGLLQPMILFITIVFSRAIIKNLLSYAYTFKNYKKKNVLVYGTGDAGRQLVLSLDNHPEFEVVGFVDSDLEMHKRTLLGVNVYSPSKLESIINSKGISLVFLALRNISISKKNNIIESLSKYKLNVKSLPNLSKIVDGKIKISDILDFEIEDLLNREQVCPDNNLLTKNINFKTVLVTGAGGSIGSELCRQIVKLKPAKLILIDLNEFAIYNICNELSELNINLNIIPLIVNVQDQKKLELILDLFNVNTIYHAAAYKHVPLVEENICEGVKNNVFSTLAIAKAAISKKVSNFVLISSDKAVKPTNIMGASKRLSELCIQGLNDQNKLTDTNFSIVRFGNVLESSGSVIPKFKKQIQDGGPVTLTHNDVTRYFMSVTEAAQLVIQAGAMGKNSEVFVLDMGKSIKIKDLISKMIKLSGYTIKDDKTPDGDIEIKIIGLRPGEKLIEELLIGDNPKKTSHSRIQMIADPSIPYKILEKKIIDLKSILDENDVLKVKKLLSEILDYDQFNSKIVDHIYTQKLLNSKTNVDLSNAVIQENNQDKVNIKN